MCFSPAAVKVAGEGGLTFHRTFPKMQTSLQPKQTDHEGRLTTHNIALSGGSRSSSKIPLSDPQYRVAIVDDDENERSFMRNTLARIPGMKFVISYSSGEEALTGIPGSGVDMVLIDIRMPGMDGIKCTRELKALMPSLRIS